ncbi:MAG TPA: hypothetical protein ENI51_03865 [Candidatus Atribacteria bacterium]|nr:hypothetical protein [Candidatus Atribacteria bacterium]
MKNRRIKAEYMFILLVVLLTVPIALGIPYLPFLLLPLLFSTILFSFILIEDKKVIVYLFLSAFAVGLFSFFLKVGENMTINFLRILLFYAFFIFISSIALKYSNKGENKSKLTIYAFLSWIVAYICTIFLDYAMDWSYYRYFGTYYVLSKIATRFGVFFIPMVAISPIVIYFAHDKVVKGPKKFSKKEKLSTEGEKPEKKLSPEKEEVENEKIPLDMEKTTQITKKSPLEEKKSIEPEKKDKLSPLKECGVDTSIYENLDTRTIDEAIKIAKNIENIKRESKKHFPQSIHNEIETKIEEIYLMLAVADISTARKKTDELREKCSEIREKIEEKPPEEVSPRLDKLLQEKEELRSKLNNLKNQREKLIFEGIMTEEMYKGRYGEIMNQLVNIEDKIIQEKMKGGVKK